MIRVVLVSLLALAACKKKDNATTEPPASSSATGSTTATTGSSAMGSSTTGSSTTAAKPTTGDKRVTDSTTWTPQTGPGFTVNASGPATTEKVPAHDGNRALDRYTFHKTDLELYVVEITEVSASEDLGMAVDNMRMRITSGTQAVQHESLIEGGEVLGRDIWYVIDQGDDTLRARSKLYGRGNKIYEVRSVSPEDKAREAEAEKFVDSFALTP